MAAGMAPDKIMFVSESARPLTIGSPNPPAPMNAASVAVPTSMTAAVRMPAIMTGAASGIGLAAARLAVARGARVQQGAFALGPVDRAAAHTDLAESYFKAGKKADAKKETIAALEIAPTYERAQTLLLKLVDGSRP